MLCLEQWGFSTRGSFVRLGLLNISILAATLVSGCSIFPDADKRTTYLEASKSESLVIPEGLQPVQKASQYRIPDNSLQGNTGDQLDIRAPSQVLTIASGSRTEEEEIGAKIWFDQTPTIDNLEAFIWKALVSYAEEEGLGIVQQDRVNLTLETGWLENQVLEGFWWWEEHVSINRARVSFKVNMRPHGRSGYVTAEVVEYEALSDLERSRKPLIQKQRLAIQALNEFIIQYDYLQRQLVATVVANRSAYSEQTLIVAENAKGEAAFTSEKRIDAVWSQTRSALEQLNFAVTDYNNSDRVYYVTYAKPESNFWGGMFGDDNAPPLPLDNGEYLVKVTGKGDVVAITFYHSDNTAFSQSLLEQISPIFMQVVEQSGLEL